MLKPIFPLVALSLACLLASPARAAEEMVDNPAYKSWAKLKPGSAVTMSMNTKMPSMEMKTGMVSKLVSVDKDKAVIEITTKLDLPGVASPPPQKQDVPAKVKKSEATPGAMPAGAKGSVKEKGTETIEVSGKKYKCKVYEFEGEQEGQKTNGKTWTSDEIPGLLAKMESSMSAGGQDMKITMAVTKIEAK